MNHSLIERARRILQPLWDEAQLRGRCWGPKSVKNPHSATNLIICVDKELISVPQRGEGMVVHEFKRTSGTKLGLRARKLLQQGGILSKMEEVLSSSGYTWGCKACGERGEVDAGLLAEVDSRGEGSRDLIRKIYQEHERVSPGCDPSNIEIFDENLVKQEELTKLIALERVS
jgi:hypothetical protein